MSFDPIQYKATTRQQWEDAADAWHRWGPVLEEWLGEATERMLDAAGVDAGEPRARRRRRRRRADASPRPDASARAAGSSPPTSRPTILALRRQGGRRGRADNVETARGSTARTWTRCRAGSFDAVISRLGLIYFPDQQRALAGMRRRAARRRPGRRRSSTRRPTATSSSPSRCRSSARRAQLAAAAARASPGRSASAAPACSRRRSTRRRVPRRHRRGRTAPLRLAVGRRVRALRARVLRRPAPDARRRARRANAPACGTRSRPRSPAFETADGFVGPCELLVAAGTR